MAIDLDAARAARREAKGDGPIVRFGGRDLKLPPELPYSVLEGVVRLQTASEDEQAGVLADVSKALLGDAHAAFVEANPSINDLQALIEGAMGEYGLGEERAASSPSSKKTSRPRKQTSSGSTA